MPIHNRDIGRRQAFDAAGHEVHDPSDLALVERLVAAQRQHHGGTGPLLVGREQAPLRHREMDACADDFSDLRDGSRELALEGAPVVQLLHEVGHADGAAVKDLESDAASRREPVAGELQAEVVDLRAGDEDRRAAARNLVGYF